MPRLQDIERFKRDLAALSHEAEVLERWGEKPATIAPPDAAAAPAPAAEAAAPSSKPSKPVPRKAPEPPPEDEGNPPDFASLLEDLPLDREPPSQEGPPADDDLSALLGLGAEEEPAEPAMPDSGAMPDFDLGSSLDLGEAPPAEAGAVPAAEPFAEPAFPSEAAPPEEVPSEEAPPTEVGFLEEADLPAGAEPVQASEPSPAEPFDFEMPDFSQEPSQEEATAEEPGSAPEEFTIPEFDLVPEAHEAPGSPVRAEEGASEDAEPLLPSPPASEESLEIGGGELGADAFETFSFEEPSAGSGTGGSEPDFGSGAGRDLDSEIASLSEEAPIADTFKIDQDWGDFGIPGGQAPKQAPPRPSPTQARARAAGSAEEKFRPIALTEAQVDRLQDSLLSYPLNLRIAIEDILANAKGTEAQESRLIWAMVDAIPVEDVAIMAGRVLKRHIAVPKGREKRTGEALEAEKGTIAYAFIHTFLPIIRVGFLVLAAAAALGYLGWRFIYVPLASDALYRAGYQRIAEDRYPEAETDFAKATAMREFIAWYYRYAQAYAEKRQYILAEQKYQSLIEAHPKENKGILAWARLEKEQLKFEEGVDVLKGAPRAAKPEYARGKTGLLSWDYFNEEGLLLLGDIYLDWADEAPAKFEDARRTYATLLEHYGDKDLYLGRMLLWFMRSDGSPDARGRPRDNKGEVLSLKTHFLADPKRSPLGADVLAELGGYLLDKGMLEDVRGILISAAEKDPALPEAHYNLARYFRSAGDAQEERKALDNSVRTFAALPGLGGRRAAMYIDSLIWRGRFLVDAREWLGAERDFAEAAAQYEKALELRRVKKDGRFGEAYAGLGDVAFWQRDDLAAALAYYERAEANGYSTRDTSYRRGNILYRTGRYPEALEQLYDAGVGGAASPYLDFAFGSAFLARNDYFSAEAYYRRSAAAMGKLLQASPEPMPQERPSEAEILRLYLRSENNLGVALYRSAARSGDARRRNEAMTAFALATKAYDQLSLVPAAFSPAESSNLALANMNTLLNSGRADKLLAYAEIEKDMKFPKGE